MKEIYQSSVKEVLGQMGSREEGLTIKEVEKSREKCGWNELAEGKKKSVLQIFLEQYKDFLVIILIASAIISGILGDAESAAVIVIVITMNAILGTVQTVKAEQSLQSLKKLSGPEAKVLRNGTVTPIPARELVVGDVILLEAGDYVPADGRLIENASLKIDESALTGESLAVEKSLDEIEEEVPLGDRNNMLFSGSFVTYGRGRAVVTSVGMQTEVGKIAGLLKSTSEKQTPLESGRVRKEAFGSDPGILRNLIWNQCISWRKYRKRVYVCSSTCGCSNPGGIKFNCNNRPFFRNAEDGQGACNHSKTAGGRRSWKCLRDLFG